MKYRILIIFLAFSCLFVHCKKEKKIPVLTLIPEFLDYCYFHKGTYWIYQDTATLYNDSIWVYDSYIDTIEVDYQKEGKGAGIADEKIETFFYKEKSKSINNIFEYSGSRICSEKQSDGVCFYAHRFIDDPENIGTILFFYEPIEGTQVDHGGTITLIKKIDSLQINNLVFYDVFLINDTQNSTENFNETNFYISKNIGIVRKEIEYEPGKWKVWNLTRYNIVQ